MVSDKGKERESYSMLSINSETSQLNFFAELGKEQIFCLQLTIYIQPAVPVFKHLKIWVSIPTIWLICLIIRVCVGLMNLQFIEIKFLTAFMKCTWHGDMLRCRLKAWQILYKRGVFFSWLMYQRFSICG